MNSWEIRNPRTGEKIKNYSYVSEESLDLSIQQLDEGFRSWKNKKWEDRQKELRKLVDYMQENKKKWSEVISAEMGKSLRLAQAEVEKCIDAVNYFCHLNLDFLSTQSIENPTYKKSHVYIEPLGVLLSIMPWNFPFWQVFRMITPAILSGNVILLKHSEVTPTCGDLVAEAFSQIGLGNILQHQLFSHQLTEKIISDHRLAGVSITGSLKAGQLISKISGQYMKKCVLELGGIDAAILLEDCSWDSAIESVVISRLQNTGQVCISIKRLIVPESQIQYVQEKIKEKYEAILSYSELALVGPLAHSKFISTYQKQVEQLSQIGNKIYEKKLSHQNLNSYMAYVDPAVFVVNENESFVNSEEIFGPALVIIPYKNIDEAIQIANSTDYGLGASVYGADINQCQKVARQLEVGQVAINDFVRTDVRLPFGGFKKSGQGREMGQQGFLEFTQTKVISVN